MPTSTSRQRKDPLIENWMETSWVNGNNGDKGKGKGKGKGKVIGVRPVSDLNKPLPPLPVPSTWEIMKAGAKAEFDGLKRNSGVQEKAKKGKGKVRHSLGNCVIL